LPLRRVEERLYRPEGLTYVTTAYVLQTPITEADWRDLRARVDAAIAPAPLSALLEALGRLWAVTARRPDHDSVETGAALQTICEALRDYPGEAALEAVREWPRTAQGKWRPTLAELLEEAETRARDIERMSKAVGRMYGPEHQIPAEEAQATVLPETAQTRVRPAGARITKRELADLMAQIDVLLEPPESDAAQQRRARAAMRGRFSAMQAGRADLDRLAKNARDRAVSEVDDNKRRALETIAQTYEGRKTDAE
jgi:hypothetical protein